MVIHKFVVHILDKDNDTPILNDYEGRVSKDVDRFFEKIVRKVKKDDDLRVAKFNNYDSNLVRNCCEQIIYDEKTFLDNSKEIAAYLFEIMRLESELVSSDLAICLYTEKDEKYIAIVRLDYKKMFNHSIDFKDEKFNIQIQTNEIGITESSRPKHAAIVGVNGINDEWQLRVLDKEAEKEGNDSYFVKKFLDAQKIEDDKYKTKVFKSVTDNFITNAFSNDIKQAEYVRGVRNYILKENSVMDIDKFIQSSKLDEDIEESLRDHLDDNGINKDFNIDKKYIEKKLKKRIIKANNGFEIKGNLSDFEDPMKFKLRMNENGTYDLVIKNLNYIEEK
ncbi:37-kD nucleoid-associated bacterial protein [uncultured Clostridium sp.]|nr:37-kD nucleoid-associated bacterial protein [uncultured Clostridium sp.]